MPQLRRIGRSIETPPLILGGNVFGWTADRETSFAVLDAFISGGGRMIDTADSYSAWVSGHKGGESETLIGEWLRRRGRREDVLIATKVGKLPGGGGEGLAPARIAAAARESLERLGTDYIDLYFAHADRGRRRKPPDPSVHDLSRPLFRGTGMADNAPLQALSWALSRSRDGSWERL